MWYAKLVRRLKKLKKTNLSFQCTLDSERYRLNDRNTKSNTKVFKCIAKHVDEVQLMQEPERFNHSDLITILSVLSKLRMAFKILQYISVPLYEYLVFPQQGAPGEQNMTIECQVRPEIPQTHMCKDHKYHEAVHFLLSTYASSKLINKAKHLFRKLLQEIISYDSLQRQ